MPFGKERVVQRGGVDVDGDARNVQPRRGPSPATAHRPVEQDDLEQARSEAARLDRVEKVAGQQGAAARVLPPCQRLEPGHAAGVGADLRLEPADDLAAVERAGTVSARSLLACRRARISSVKTATEAGPCTRATSQRGFGGGQEERGVVRPAGCPRGRRRPRR